MNTPWTVTLGHDVSGEAVQRDLSAAPHILLCGTSGSGKSVGVHALLHGLITAGTPQDTQIVILDPKRVEFNVWRPAPHVRAVITDREAMVKAVQGAVEEMDARYSTMERAGVSDVSELSKPLPRLFLVCDELADLTMASRDKQANLRAALVLGGLTRIAQLGRAAGVHLIVATQRPAADTLPGNLRANLGTRWAFRVRTRSESRIALDAPGAELLASAPGSSLLSWRGAAGEYVQGAYVSREDISAAVSEAVATYGKARRTSAPSGSKSPRWSALSPRMQVWVAAGIAGYVLVMQCAHVGQ